MQGKDSDEMVHGVAPMVAHNPLDVGFSLAGLRSSRGIVSLGRLRRFQERVGHGLAVERPAASVDHECDHEKINGSTNHPAHFFMLTGIVPKRNRAGLS